MARIATGDSDARTDLLSRHRQRLRQLVDLRMDPRLRSRFDGSDVIQEALVIANARLESFAQQQIEDAKQDGISLSFYPWLRGIVMDKLLNLRERHLADKRNVGRETRQRDDVPDGSVATLVDRLAGDVLSPSQQATREEDCLIVREALERLQHRDREVLELRYLEHLRVAEVGAVLGITPAAVRTRHFRAIQRLHAALKSSQNSRP